MDFTNFRFPKPATPKPLAVQVFDDGREVCNLATHEGRMEYMRRVDQMVERQNGICGYYGTKWQSPLCCYRITLGTATFEHVDGRGMGGARRDDRIEIMTSRGLAPYNLAVCEHCNMQKGSQR